MRHNIDPPVFTTEGDSPKPVATAFIDFVAAAKTTIDIAIYDFRLADPLRHEIVGCLLAAAKRGVKVRIAYDHTKANQGATNKGEPDSDPAPRGTDEFVRANFPAASGVELAAVAGSHLMHNKYIVRDADTDAATVWMGSANFTGDAWQFQENNILRVHSKDLAAHYEQDFNDLWTNRNIVRTGMNDYGSVAVGKVNVEFAFAPGEGSAAASLFVDAVQGAGKSIWISTMVLSSGPILGALNDYLDAGGTLRGIYDHTQMTGVEKDWQPAGKPVSPKLAQWLRIKPMLVGKKSNVYSPSAKHNFMHNKFLVTDHTIVTGSFNLSSNAESNAENVLSISDSATVKAYLAYVEKITKRYS